MKNKRYNLKEKITITIRPEIVRQIDEIADREYTTRSALIDMILRSYLLGRFDNGERTNTDTA